MSTTTSAVENLAAQLSALDVDPVAGWAEIDEVFRGWATRPDVHSSVRQYLSRLSPSAVTARSKEATTHYAWCLRDKEEEPFTFWIHEYKPFGDWRPGYADSVHNHRYHFCTTLLHGSYQHERYDVTIDQATGLIVDAELRRSTTFVAGDTGALLFTDFHRIPYASDGTKTFLVKSRQIAPWSLSYDATMKRGFRHVPAASRLIELVGDI